MKIFFWPSDPGGCKYYRCDLPAGGLATLGHESTVSQQMPDWARDGEADVIVAQRLTEPGPLGLFKRLSGKSKLVYEVDDDLWHLDPSNRDAYRAYGPDELRRAREAIEVADLVTVTTEPLADLLSAWNPNVTILPNMIPAALLQHTPDSSDTRVTIGWGGSPSHARDFGELARPLRIVLQRFGDAVEFHCMGADYTDRCSSRRGRTRFSGWHRTVDSYLGAVDFHIGLAPLRPTAFNDAKSDIKLLEYAALGIPALVSNVGPYARAVQNGAPAVTVTGRGWEDPLVELIQHPDQRAEYSKLAREWAAARTIEANAWRWEEAYR